MNFTTIFSAALPLALLAGCGATSISAASSVGRMPALSFATAEGATHACVSRGEPRVLARTVSVPDGIAMESDGRDILVRYATRPHAMTHVRLDAETLDRKVCGTPDHAVPASGEATVNGAVVRLRTERYEERRDIFLDVEGLPRARGDHEVVGEPRIALDANGRGAVAFFAAVDTGIELVVVPLACR